MILLKKAAISLSILYKDKTKFLFRFIITDWQEIKVDITLTFGYCIKFYQEKWQLYDLVE